MFLPAEFLSKDAETVSNKTFDGKALRYPVDLGKQYSGCGFMLGDLRESILCGVFYGCNFAGADFQDARLDEGLFVECNFFGAEFNGARFFKARFFRCKFNEANLAGARGLTVASFDDECTFERVSGARYYRIPGEGQGMFVSPTFSTEGLRKLPRGSTPDLDGTDGVPRHIAREKTEKVATGPGSPGQQEEQHKTKPVPPPERHYRSPPHLERTPPDQDDDDDDEYGWYTAWLGGSNGECAPATRSGGHVMGPQSPRNYVPERERYGYGNCAVLECSNIDALRRLFAGR